MPIGKRKTYSLKNDAMFKEFFSRKKNESLLKDFLSELLKRKIKKIEVQKDSVLNKEIIKGKTGILDIKATLDEETIVDIEMQMKRYNYMTERATFYSSKLISNQLESGTMYHEIKPVIVIMILNYNMFEFKEYITETVTVSKDHRDMEINKDQKYYYIELPKFREKEREKNKMTDWLTFIDGESKERIEEAMGRNSVIKKAKEELEKLNADEEARIIAEAREKAIRDEASFRADAYESGIREGREKGMQEGREEGIKEGIKENSKKVARNLLNKKVDISTIIEVTNLSREEIEKIKLL